ncbi:phototropic-responsive NPH3 family protein [Tanacetum coccineum]
MSVLLGEKSGLLCNWFKENPNAGRLSFDHIPTPETFRLIARFCCGQEVNFTPENIIPILFLAFSLDMSQSPNSLYQQALCFFIKKIITGWNESLKALKAMENQIDLNHGHYFIGKCMDSIVNIAISDPLLLGEPVNDDFTDDDEDEDEDSEDEENDDSEEDDVDEEEEGLSLTTAS